MCMRQPFFGVSTFCFAITIVIFGVLSSTSPLRGIYALGWNLGGHGQDWTGLDWFREVRILEYWALGMDPRRPSDLLAYLSSKRHEAQRLVVYMYKEINKETNKCTKSMKQGPWKQMAVGASATYRYASWIWKTSTQLSGGEAGQI